MLRRPSPEPPVTEATRRRLAALRAELLGEPPADESDEAIAERSRGRHAHTPLPSRERAAGWVLDRAATPRWQWSTAHLGVVALVLAVGVLGAAWWLHGGTSPGTVVRPTITAPSVAPTAADPSSTARAVTPVADPTGLVVVDVVGKVRSPGIRSLPVGSRVADAIKAAGGLRRGVHDPGVNLARVLVDGEQVIVGGATPSVPGAGAPVSATTALVSLNTADATALETLPGVGPVTAQAIIGWRTEHGGFASIDELLDVSGIGDATLAQIAPHVTL